MTYIEGFGENFEDVFDEKKHKHWIKDKLSFRVIVRFAVKLFIMALCLLPCILKGVGVIGVNWGLALLPFMILLAYVLFR